MPATAKRPAGFSLVEVLVALTIIGLASSTLLLATASTVQSGNDALSQTIARGIAEQLLDEAIGRGYHERGGSATSWPLGPESGETSNPAKSILFDDTDDYAGYSMSPPADPWAIELGHGDGAGSRRPEAFRLRDGYFSGWSVKVTVTYVDENDPQKDLTPPTTSVMRAVRVQVFRNWDGTPREIVSLRRVLAYVPPLRT
jgi:prepilin-type N-terminal cleavage/methylation domain-containing protein